MKILALIVFVVSFISPAIMGLYFACDRSVVKTLRILLPIAAFILINLWALQTITKP